MKRWIDGWKRWTARPAAAVVLSLLACVLLPAAYCVMIEFVRIGSVYYLVQYLQPHLAQLALGAVVLALVFAVATLLTARPWAASLLVGGVLCAASWANLQKLVYRGEPVLPKDLFQLSAAAGIATEMTFTVPRETWLFLLLVAGSTLVLLPVRLPFGRGGRGWLGRLGLAACAAGLLAGYMQFVIYDKEYMRSQGAVMAEASMADTYYRCTFVTGFSMLTESMFGVEKPEGYAEQAVLDAAALLQAEDAGAAQAQRQCDVIVVLLESYFELFNYDTAVYSEPLYENWQRLQAEGVSGYLLSEKYGGGTANVEFSVLSGFSTALLSAGSVPYIEYVDDGFLCYPQYLKAQGYRTIALHPYKRSFYNRENSYPRMGFDTFVTEEAFTAADVLGNYVGEQATFDKALELYAQAAQDGPVFLHIVTMQNHIPNQPDEYPDEHEVTASIPGESDYYNGCLSSVATSLRDIDRAVGVFTDALREADRDVVVLFFGDHQTNVNGDVGEDLLSHMEGYNALSPAEQTVASHLTPYLVWANFEAEAAGTDAGVLPAYLLLPTMLCEYNVTRPAWMDWLYASAAELQNVTYELLFAAEEEREAVLTDRQKQVYAAQQMLQYDLMFGKRYSGARLYGAAE